MTETASESAADEIVPAGVPESFPDWSKKLAQLYFSGTSSVFALHGNVFDYVRAGEGEASEFIDLTSFLAAQLFGRWDLVLYYDIASGLRPIAGRDQQRLQEMVQRVSQHIGDLSKFPKDPDHVFNLLDRLVQKNLVATDGKHVQVAVLLGHASHLFPRGEPGRLKLGTATNMVRVLNWASSPYVKRLNMAFVMIDAEQAALNDRLTGNPHVASIEVELPNRDERFHFTEHAAKRRDLAKFSDFGTSELADLTAGVSLSDIDALIESAYRGWRSARRGSVPCAEEAIDREAVSGPARVHSAELGSRHGRGSRGRQGAVA